jgi:glycosyltransferase involved in cell wall biosynthesis
MEHHMRVIMFPGKGNENENRYIDILVEALGAAGVRVEDWHKEITRQTGDIFHVHWPDVIANIRARKWQRLRGDLIDFQFFRTIDRIHSRGGALVWTVHNLLSHDASLTAKPYHGKLMERFIPRVDSAISLTSAGIPDIKRGFPALRDVPFSVARHPHYRTKLGIGGVNSAARERLNIKPGQRVFSLLGSLRPAKGPDLVLSAFRDFPKDEAFLILAGSASEQLQRQLRDLAADMSNVLLDFRRIPESELLELYAVTDVLVFPGEDYFNSGTTYTSLSLNVPVIASWTPTNAEIQSLVGPQWLNLYKGALTGQTLRAGRAALVQRTPDITCDLAEFSPERCAQQHIEAYKMALTLRKAKAASL